jgi:hypothetical protein
MTARKNRGAQKSRHAQRPHRRPCVAACLRLPCLYADSAPCRPSPAVLNSDNGTVARETDNQVRDVAGRLSAGRAPVARAPNQPDRTALSPRRLPCWRLASCCRPRRVAESAPSRPGQPARRGPVGGSRRLRDSPGDHDRPGRSGKEWRGRVAALAGGALPSGLAGHFALPSCRTCACRSGIARRGCENERGHPLNAVCDRTRK